MSWNYFIWLNDELQLTERAFCSRPVGTSCADILCYFTRDLSLGKDKKLRVYLPAGRQVPKVGYVREAGTVADMRNVDEDMLCYQHSSKPNVISRLIVQL